MPLLSLALASTEPGVGDGGVGWATGDDTGGATGGEVVGGDGVLGVIVISAQFQN